MKIRIATTLFICFATSILSLNTAQARLSPDQALQRVKSAVGKYHLFPGNQLQCLSFEKEDQQSSDEMIFDVSEIHNARCDHTVDPNTAPRIGSVLINLRTGKIKVEDPVEGNYKPIPGE